MEKGRSSSPPSPDPKTPDLRTSPLSLLERILDYFFEAQQRAFWKVTGVLFGYFYRETERGMFGLFDSPEAISTAARRARDRGYTNFDCLTPFPVHGLEFEMGLERSRVPYITFFAGTAGLLIGFLLQLIVHEQVVNPLLPYLDGFPNIRSYALNIGGKPTFSWPPMVPICFEITVLLGGHTTVLGLILLARLYRPFRKVLHPDITNDKFCLWIPADSANYNAEELQQFFKELQASEITTVGAEESLKN